MGKRVKCPHCQAVVPVTPTAAAAPPTAASPRPSPATAPSSNPAVVVPKPVPRPVAAPGPALPPTIDEVESPPENPWEVDEPAKPTPSKGAKGVPARDTKRRRDEPDDRDRDRKPTCGRDRGGDEDWEARRRPAGAGKGWKSFGAGCGLVKWGMWFEFLAVVYLAALVGYLWMSFHNSAKPELVASAGVYILAPFSLGLLLGTGLIFMGRLRMLIIPSGSGAGGVFFGTFVFTGLRGMALLGSAVFLLVAASEGDKKVGSESGKFLGLCFLSWFAAVLPGILAELTAIPGMAIVGGSIPNLTLRRRAGMVTFVLQMVAVMYIGTVALGALAGDSLRSSGVNVRDFAVGASPKPKGTTLGSSSGPNRESIALMGYAVLGMFLFLEFLYTALHATMYGAGQTAARQSTEAAEDRDES